MKVKVIREIEVCHEDLFEGEGGFMGADDMIVIPEGSEGILTQNKGDKEFTFTSGPDEDHEDFFPPGVFKIPLEDDELPNFVSEIK